MRDTLRYPESITAVTWLEYCRFGLDVKRRPYWGLQPPGTQKTVSLDFDEQMAREGRQRNFKISQILPIRRKTLFKQSINLT